MWYESAFEYWRIALSAVLGFGVLLVFLRLAGKRTVAKFNAYDMVLTFTIGSLLASMILLKDVKILEGIFAMGVLTLLDWSVTTFAMRFDGFRHWLKAEPRLLVYNGQYQFSNMKRERIVQEEVLMFMRQNGVHKIEDVKAMVLETAGDVSVLTIKGDEASLTRSLRQSGVDVDEQTDDQRYEDDGSPGADEADRSPSPQQQSN